MRTDPRLASADMIGFLTPPTLSANRGATAQTIAGASARAIRPAP